MSLQIVCHELEPVFDGDSKVLILGTMPSPKSRLFGFYYSHPQNKFWKVIASVFREAIPETKEEKEQFLIAHNIAMWDVLKSCVIKGADDNSIVDPMPNDLNLIIKNAEIRAVFTTGKKATDLYKKLCDPVTERPSIYVPSTSPANCRNYTFESLVEAYRIILEYM